MRRQPERASVFAWLFVVAIHEAYRLSAIERRELHLEDFAIEGDWDTILAGRRGLAGELERDDGGHELRLRAAVPVAHDALSRDPRESRRQVPG